MEQKEFVKQLTEILKLDPNAPGVINQIMAGKHGELTDEPVGEFMPTGYDKPVKVKGRIVK